MSTDFVDHSAFPGIPADRGGVRLLFAMLRSGFPDLQATVHDQVADDDKVVTRKTLHGTHRGEFMGIPPTGRSAALEIIDILRVRDGKITDHWCVVDQLGLLQQLGVIPAPGAEPAPAGVA